MSDQNNDAGKDARKKDRKRMDSSRKASDTDPTVTSAIGGQLKRLYDQVAQEPVPDRFTKLLEQLARQESDRKGE